MVEVTRPTMVEEVPEASSTTSSHLSPPATPTGMETCTTRGARVRGNGTDAVAGAKASSRGSPISIRIRETAESRDPGLLLRPLSSSTSPRRPPSSSGPFLPG